MSASGLPASTRTMSLQTFPHCEVERGRDPGDACANDDDFGRQPGHAGPSDRAACIPSALGDAHDLNGFVADGPVLHVRSADRAVLRPVPCQGTGFSWPRIVGPRNSKHPGRVDGSAPAWSSFMSEMLYNRLPCDGASWNSSFGSRFRFEGSSSRRPAHCKGRGADSAQDSGAPRSRIG